MVSMQIHALWSGALRPVAAARDGSTSVTTGPVDAYVPGPPTESTVVLPSQDLDRLSKLDFRMGLQTMTYFDAELSPQPEIDALVKAVGRGRVPDQAARALTGVAHSCTVRERANLPPGHRHREPVEQDRAWARACLKALTDWRDKGQLEIRYQGRPITPEDDLYGLVAAGRPAVRDGVVHLHAPPPPAPPRIAALAEEVLSELPAQSNVPAPGLDKLAAMEPMEAALVVGALLDRFDLVGNADDIDRVIRLVKHAPLKQALEPHAERLARVGSEAEARGRLAWSFGEGRHKVWLLKELVQVFPQVADPQRRQERPTDFFERELAPFLLCDELNSSHAAVELAGTRPDWTRQALDLYTSQSDLRLDEQQHRLMHQGLKEGHWRPDAAQQEWLARRLELPDASVFKYEGSAENFRYTLRSVRMAAEQDPTAFSEDLRDRLLERLLSDPTPKLSEGLYREPNGVDPYRMMGDAMAFVFHPPGGRVDRLVSELDGPRGEAALALLASLELPEELSERLAERLEPEMRREPPPDRRDLDTLGRIAEQFRPRRMAALPAREALQLAYKMPSQRGFSPPPVDKVVEELVQRHRSEASELPVLAAGKLESFTPEQLAEVELCEGMTRGRPERKAFLDRFGLELREHKERPTLLEGVVRRLRQAALKEALEQLRSGELPVKERLEQLELAGNSREAWQALRQGLSQGEDSRARCSEQLKKDGELRAALEHLGDQSERWDRFEKLYALTDRKFPDALNASRALESAIERGQSPEEAWKAALKGWLYEDGSTGGPGLVVGVEGDSLRVGSVRVPIRRPEGTPSPETKDGP